MSVLFGEKLSGELPYRSILARTFAPSAKDFAGYPMGPISMSAGPTEAMRLKLHVIAKAVARA